ncbi:MAG: deoxyribodipyrimidine photo-lyase [Wenzhouxiangellaceae bacterium]
MARLLGGRALLFGTLPASSRSLGPVRILAVNVVWFKRDLRVDDHRPLVEACRRGPVLPVLLDEPEGWAQPDMARRHREFVAESIADLDEALRRRGQGLLVLRGPALESLDRLRREFGMRTVFAHQETGNGWSFQRDRDVRRWCHESAIEFHEFPQFGVIRGLRDRQGWAALGAVHG